MIRNTIWFFVCMVSILCACGGEEAELDLCANVDCGEHGKCYHYEGKVNCACNYGYYAAGLYCVKEAEPEPEPETPCTGVHCSWHGDCVLVSGKATCKCDSGYREEGLTCIENETCTGVTCSGHGICVVYSGYATCNCDRGYSAVGLTCVEDPCEGVSCSNHGTCEVTNSNPSCICDSGYHAIGLQCVANTVDPCEGVICSNHGNCIASSNTAVCDCDDGYHAVGLSCIEDSDPCSGVTCSNHGTCETLTGNATCTCDNGYHAEGLTCIKDEPTCTESGVSCSAVNYEECCVDTHCSYDFSDGTKLWGETAATGYCMGENDGTEDGNCSGIATSCLEYGSQSGCETNPRCTWEPDPGICDGIPHCWLEYTSTTCNAVAGCYWTQPEINAPPAGCSMLKQDCIPGRRYRFCENNADGESRFENGVTLQGTTATRGYCLGETDGSDDGQCGGVSSVICSSINTQAACDQVTGCTYMNGNVCVGVPSCYNSYTSAACLATGCNWTPM